MSKNYRYRFTLHN